MGGFMRRIVLVLAVLLLAACASNPGVIKTGENSYIVSRQAKTGLAGVAAMRAKAMNDANEYCAKQGKQAEMTGHSQSSGVPIFGNFPRADIEFKCVSSSSGH